MTESIAPPTTYRALVMTEDHRMVLRDRQAAEPAPGDAVVEVIATGICGSDIHGLAGDTGRRSSGQVMGHETAGRVVAVGSDVNPSLLGELVTINPVFGCGTCAFCAREQTQQCVNGWVLGVRTDVDGAFSERVTVPAINLVVLPAGMPAWHGAIVEPLAVGYHAVMRGVPSAVDRVLVIGGGPIGQAAALAARRVGASSVVVSEPDAGRAQTLRRLGFTTLEPATLAESLAEALGGVPSLVIDAVGSDRSLATAFELAAPDARIVLVGMASPELHVPAYQVSARERHIIGAFCYAADEFRSTVAWLGEHPEIPEIFVDRREALASGEDVFDELLAGRVLPNKVLLFPRPEETV